MPKNTEVEQAVMEHQRLFREHSQQVHLQQLRQTAIEAMEFFHSFRPRLVGPVLHGTADEHSEVSLHLFADNVEDVIHFLRERAIPFRQKQRRYRFASGKEAYLPVFTFLAGETVIDVAVFANKQHEAPLSPVDGRAMQRVSLAELQERMQADANMEQLLSGRVV
jgi:hypothetical protein